MSDWEKSIEEGKIIKINPNLERSRGLFKSFINTLNFAEKNKLEEENVGVLISNYYESLIEILHSLMYQKGFKVLDHISFTYFLKEKLNRTDYSLLFDKYRRIRNNIVYYGKQIDIDTAKQGIKDIKELIEFIKKELKN